MKLNPQCEAVLTALSSMGPMPGPDLLTAKMMREFSAMQMNAFAPGDPIASIEDINIDGPSGPLRLRVYRPHSDKALLPATLYLHGGGFVCGAVEGFDNICQALAQRAETIVVSVDYRLAPEAKFPAASQDALAGLQWVYDHAVELGVESSKLALAGDSAGANLAVVLAQQIRETELNASVCLQLLFYPILDHGRNTESHRLFKEGYMLTGDLCQWFWEQYLPDGADVSHSAISPLCQNNWLGIAPAAVVTAGFDPLRDDGRAYVRVLQEQGIDAELQEWPDQIHGFVSMLGGVDAADEALSYGAEALRNAFG